MATQFFYIEGTVNWAKVYEPVLKYQSKTEYEWSLDFKPDNPEEFTATKSQKKFRDGFIKLTRDVERNDKDGNKINEEPPKVLIRVEEENVPFTSLIGNGSKAIVKVAVYDTRMGKGTRLEGLVVLDHVPYEGGTPTAPISTSDGGEVLPF